MKKFLARGFTLVELLIVIALLSAIALIVIAAINPLEQTNRTRDTRLKADGSQLISAIDRYFTAKSEFPWVTSDNVTYTNDSSFGYASAADPLVGLCNDSGCTTDGALITSLELKSEFRNRDFIKATDVTKKLFIGKDQGPASSVYACFVPASKSNRDGACNDNKVYTISGGGGRTPVSCTPSSQWQNSWYICVPD